MNIHGGSCHDYKTGLHFGKTKLHPSLSPEQRALLTGVEPKLDQFESARNCHEMGIQFAVEPFSGFDNMLRLRAQDTDGQDLPDDGYQTVILYDKTEAEGSLLKEILDFASKILRQPIHLENNAARLHNLSLAAGFGGFEIPPAKKDKDDEQ